MTQSFSPGDRTYYVSDERLRVFRELTTAEKLRWVEEMAMFLRLARIGKQDSEPAELIESPGSG